MTTWCCAGVAVGPLRGVMAIVTVRETQGAKDMRRDEEVHLIGSCKPLCLCADCVGLRSDQQSDTLTGWGCPLPAM